jgi:GNAT superfamily N-acetyltransferase
MNIRYEMMQGLPDEPLQTALLDLLTHIFDNQSRAELLSELTYQATQTGVQTLLAIVDGRVVGCKLGYERKPGHYYSWLGGVHPDFRGRGIAAELMRQQHDWCRQHHYHTLRTQTYNQWRNMLILNLRHGFDIIGTMQGKHGLTIVLEKRVG